tara:strand:+ start:3559 stop:4392 length:834 start_codon:yes stop_codon:yes gene_type:complete
METIVGLGNTGCKIVDLFAQYSQYKTYKLDVGLTQTKTTFPLQEHEKLEDYEEKLPSLQHFFRGVRGPLLFVVGGGGKISSATLAILKYLKNKCKISVLYLQPDLSLLNEKQIQLERMVYNILQQYARSGALIEMILVSNTSLEEVCGGLSIKDYFKIINETIVSTLHMINIYRHNVPLFHTFDKKPAGVRISTFGICDPVSHEEKMFFSLDNVSDVVYYYAYNKDELETNLELINQIKKTINKKKKNVKRVTYGVYETDYPLNYVYCFHSTSLIQQ